MPTLCDVGRAPYPGTFQGRPVRPAPGQSLLTVLRGGSLDPGRTLYWEHERHAAVRWGRWKLVTLDATKDEAWELYDVTDDRSETRSLAGEQPERIATMKRLWTAWARQTNVLPWPPQR